METPNETRDLRLFHKLVKAIESEYQQLDHSLGWRFLTCSRKNLCPSTKVLFLTLNPGGTIDRADHPSASCENGSAYVVESWSGALPGKSKLQVQIRTVFDLIRVDIDSVLSGQMVPFRSPSWASLPRRGESLSFGKRLWGKVIRYVNPSLIITMGKSELRPIVHEILGEPSESRDVAVGWGRVSAGLDVYPNTRVVSLPHLSRFGIITRPQSQAGLRELFGTKV